MYPDSAYGWVKLRRHHKARACSKGKWYKNEKRSNSATPFKAGRTTGRRHYSSLYIYPDDRNDAGVSPPICVFNPPSNPWPHHESYIQVIHASGKLYFKAARRLNNRPQSQSCLALGFGNSPVMGFSSMYCLKSACPLPQFLPILIKLCWRAGCACFECVVPRNMCCFLFVIKDRQSLVKKVTRGVSASVFSCHRCWLLPLLSAQSSLKTRKQTQLR